jgi:hypothetical protein
MSLGLRNACKLKGRDHLEDQHTVWRITLKWTFEKGWEGVDWIYLA